MGAPFGAQFGQRCTLVTLLRLGLVLPLICVCHYRPGVRRFANFFHDFVHFTLFLLVLSCPGLFPSLANPCMLSTCMLSSGVLLHLGLSSCVLSRCHFLFHIVMYYVLSPCGFRTHVLSHCSLSAIVENFILWHFRCRMSAFLDWVSR